MSQTSRPSRDYTWSFQFSVRQILVLLILLFIARPIEETVWGQRAETVLYSLVLLSTLVAVGARRLELLISLILILPALGFRLLSDLFSFLPTDALPRICMALAFCFTIFQLLRFVVRARRVNLDVLCAGISVYLLLGQVWGFFYMLIDRWVPGSFIYPGLAGHAAALGREEAFYFSMCTITTAGYGDIVPSSAFARTLATLESTTGVLYMAVLIGRLVALHLANHSRSGPAAEDTKASP
jgi:voltage-gated potassium channel